MNIAFIFGGAGYIGGFLLRTLLENKVFDKIIIYDINELIGFERDIEQGVVAFKKLDIRFPIPKIDISKYEVSNSWIFNFAAVHREPGHEFQEYFDTNIPGAENVTKFARDTGIENIFFTSSIAPYGRSLLQRTEESTLYPETAYGISKALAEKIHQLWLKEDESRKLVIVRPSVIYGPKDPGNVYRMIKSIRKGTFVLPGGGKVIKAYGYVYGLIDSMLFAMAREEKMIIYNYAENPIIPLEKMAQVVKSEFDYKKPVLKLSIKLLSMIAFFIQLTFKIIGKKSDIHPVRVKKAGFPTNIKPQFLIDNGFKFKYGFEKSLKHWRKVSPSDFK